SLKISSLETKTFRETQSKSLPICNGTYEFRCLTSSECVPRLWQCDSILDCQDGSDEWLQNEFNLIDYDLDVFDDPLRSTEHSMVMDDNFMENLCIPCASEEMFRCQIFNECIPLGWKCDGQFDCGLNDDTDESDPQCKSFFTKSILAIKSHNHSIDESSSKEPEEPCLFIQYGEKYFILMNNLTNNSPGIIIEGSLADQNFWSHSFATIDLIKDDTNICWRDIKNSTLDCLAISSNGVLITNRISIPRFVDLKQIEGISLDNKNEIIHMLGKKSEIIYKCNFSNNSIDCRIVLDHRILSRPLDFKIDHDANIMFVSRQGDRSRDVKHHLSPAIFRVDSRTGKNLKILVQIAIIEPSLMAIDSRTKILYWIDSRLDVLECIDYYGQNRKRFSLIDSKSIEWRNFFRTVSFIIQEDSIFLLMKHQQQMKKEKSTLLHFKNDNNSTKISNETTILTLKIIQAGNNVISKQTFRSMSYLDASILIKRISNKSENYVEKEKTHENEVLKANEIMIAQIKNPELNHHIQSELVLIYSRMNPGLIKFKTLDSESQHDQDDSSRQERLHNKQIDGMHQSMMPITFSKSPITFDIDPFDQKIYYLEDNESKLLFHDLFLNKNTVPLSVNRTPTMIRSIDLRNIGLFSRIEALAFDWCEKNIYVMDRKSISLLKIKPYMEDNNTDSIYQAWRKVIITDLIEPSALEIDCDIGLIFYVTSLVYKADEMNEYMMNAIKKSNMDGSDSFTIIQFDQTIRIHSIALDRSSRTIYWCDISEKRINRIQYDGQNLQKLIKSSFISLANSMTFHRNTLWWIELQHGMIQRFQIDFNKTDVCVKERAPLFHMKIYDPFQKKPKKILDEKKCEHFKIRKFRSDSICLCDDHYRLDINDQCVPIDYEELTEKFCQPNEKYSPEGRNCLRKPLERSINSKINFSDHGR
ncbi:hypothetical protein SSS_06358, partial [Sarcoptes scabiei]